MCIVPSCSDLLELASETESHKGSGKAKEGEGSGAEEKQATKRKGLEEDQDNLGLLERLFRASGNSSCFLLMAM